jgi:hypothetical protein
VLNLFVENTSDSLSDLLQFEALLELIFNLLAEISLSTFPYIKGVNFLQEREADFINNGDNTYSHSLNTSGITGKVALTSWIILLTYESCLLMNS